MENVVPRYVHVAVTHLRRTFNWASPLSFILALVVAPVMEMVAFLLLIGGGTTSQVVAYVVASACIPAAAAGISTVASEFYWGTAAFWIRAPGPHLFHQLLVRLGLYALVGAIPALVAALAGRLLIGDQFTWEVVLATMVLGTGLAILVGATCVLIALAFRVVRSVFLVMNLAIFSLVLGALTFARWVEAASCSTAAGHFQADLPCDPMDRLALTALEGGVLWLFAVALVVGLCCLAWGPTRNRLSTRQDLFS